MVLFQAGFYLPCWLLHLLAGAPSVPRPHHRRIVAWRQRVCDLRALLAQRDSKFCCGRFCVLCPEFVSRIVLLLLVLLGMPVG